MGTETAMIGKHLHLVLAGALSLGTLSPCRAADNGPAHFNPNALLAEGGVGGTLPNLDRAERRRVPAG
jgi:hypothetical protein